MIKHLLDFTKLATEPLHAPFPIVRDPFLGSCTALLAAFQLGCDFVGCDIDPDVVKVCRDRFNTEHKKNSGLTMATKVQSVLHKKEGRKNKALHLHLPLFNIEGSPGAVPLLLERVGPSSASLADVETQAMQSLTPTKSPRSGMRRDSENDGDDDEGRREDSEDDKVRIIHFSIFHVAL